MGGVPGDFCLELPRSPLNLHLTLGVDIAAFLFLWFAATRLLVAAGSSPGIGLLKRYVTPLSLSTAHRWFCFRAFVPCEGGDTAAASRLPKANGRVCWPFERAGFLLPLPFAVFYFGAPPIISGCHWPHVESARSIRRYAPGAGTSRSIRRYASDGFKSP